MNFKIGDKVIAVICDTYCEKYKGKIGEITDTDRIKRRLSHRWDYEVTFDDGFDYPFSPWEIKKAITKNQQLLFDFMD